VEVGPGIGVLTRELTKRVKKVTAIEIDPRFPRLLKQFATGKAELDIQLANALHTPMPLEPYKVVANIPYHITSPLLRHVFLESERTPTSMTLLIQKEVAEKICDQKHAGLLTITVALFGTPSVMLHVPKQCFIPPPEVESAVLHIECFSKPLADPPTIDAVLRLAKTAFGQKRKMLSNSLGQNPSGIERMKKAGIDPMRRPETLSIEEWITLAKVDVPEQKRTAEKPPRKAWKESLKKKHDDYKKKERLQPETHTRLARKRKKEEKKNKQPLHMTHVEGTQTADDDARKKKQREGKKNSKQAEKKEKKQEN
jgi:16S rRNA (adenine1518-N6/adenine1519-N6)-dimethyltransferase